MKTVDMNMNNAAQEHIEFLYVVCTEVEYKVKIFILKQEVLHEMMGWSKYSKQSHEFVWWYRCYIKEVAMVTPVLVYCVWKVINKTFDVEPTQHLSTCIFN